jgi:hypothetical protein
VYHLDFLRVHQELKLDYNLNLSYVSMSLIYLKPIKVGLFESNFILKAVVISVLQIANTVAVVSPPRQQ